MSDHVRPPSRAFPARFHVAVDVVALTITDGILEVAAVQRDSETACVDVRRSGRVTELRRDPRHHWALPGGHVRWDQEDLADAAARELLEETGLDLDADALHQVGAYGTLHRDPRPGRTVSVAYLAFQPRFAIPRAGSDAHRARFVPVLDLLAAPNRLEFDHERILLAAIQRVRDLLLTTPVATAFCAPEFTMAELREVYEVMWHEAYDLETSPDRRERWAERVREWMGSEEVRLLGQLESERSGRASPADVYDSLALSSPRMTYQLARLDDADLERVARIMLRSARRRAPKAPRLRRELDPSNFQRKVEAIDGFVERVPDGTRSTGSVTSQGAGRPAQLYRAGTGTRLEPPLRLEVKKGPGTGRSRRG